MLETIIIISLICVAINIATWKSMILHEPAKYIENIITKIVGEKLCYWILEPLYKCPICMGSLWTIIIWLHEDCSFRLIPVLLGVVGLNTLFLSATQNLCPKDEDK